MSDVEMQPYATVVEVLIPGPQGPGGNDEIGGHAVSIGNLETGHIIVFDGEVWHNQPLGSGGDMMRAVYDTNNDGKVDVAKLAEAVSWDGITDIPASFPPELHGHAIADVTDLQAALDEKAALTSPAFSGAPTAPTATIGTNTTQLATTAFVTAAVAAVSPGSVSWADVADKPSSFTPSEHSHVIADVTGLSTALDDKAPLASPALTGTPTAPTALVGTDTAQVATTAFVNASIAATPMANLRNKIINGHFWLWRRGATQSVVGYKSADRWYLNTAGSGVTCTLSQQVMNGTGWPKQILQDLFYARLVFTTGTGSDRYVRLEHRIEDVVSLSGQQATLTFWARAATTGLSIAANLSQVFGSGGSAAVHVNGQKTSLGTNWQKVSFVFDIPGIAGKTIGASNCLNAVIWASGGGLETAITDNLPAQSGTIDISHVSLVPGDARDDYDALEPRHNQQEMALCERYYEISGGSITWTQPGNAGAIQQHMSWPFLVPKRITPTVTVTAELGSAELVAASSRHINVRSGGTGEQRNSFIWTADAEL